MTSQHTAAAAAGAPAVQPLAALLPDDALNVENLYGILPVSSLTRACSRGEVVHVVYSLANVGAVAWPADATVRLVHNTPGWAGLPTEIGLPEPVLPAQVVELHVEVLAPSDADEAAAVWALCSLSSAEFGLAVRLVLQVLAAGNGSSSSIVAIPSSGDMDLRGPTGAAGAPAVELAAVDVREPLRFDISCGDVGDVERPHTSDWWVQADDREAGAEQPAVPSAERQQRRRPQRTSTAPRSRLATTEIERPVAAEVEAQLLQSPESSPPPAGDGCAPAVPATAPTVDASEQAVDNDDGETRSFRGDDSEGVRNITIIAHVDHGKTTLADSLLGAAAALNPNQVGDRCALDTGLEAERGITIHSTAVTLRYTAERNGVDLTVNLIDSPGHVDFNSEVAAALRLTDGALVIVDVVEGVCVQTRRVLQQALEECVQPVLVLNKFDRLLLEKHMEVDDIWAQMEIVVDQVNSIITMSTSEANARYLRPVSLQDGTVCFGSGYYGWLATSQSIASLFATKGDGAAEKVLAALSGTSSAKHFKKLALEPIAKIHAAASAGDASAVAAMLVPLLGDERVRKLKLADTPNTKGLLRSAMGSFMPAGEVLLRFISRSLPSPAVAQRARLGRLYRLSIEDAGSCELAVGRCDDSEAAPVVCYVGKMVPVGTGGKGYFALARVFAGRMRRGVQLHLCGAAGADGQVAGSRSARVTQVVEVTPQGRYRVDEVGAGRICGLFGVEDLLAKCGTLASEPGAAAMAEVAESVHPVVSCAVTSASASGVAKLADALRLLSKSDPCVQCSFDRETTQHVVSCAGELHLEVCIERLKTMASDVRVLPVVVAHREGVEGRSPSPCLAKTKNKLNRFYFVASPLDPELTEELAELAVAPSEVARTRRFVDQYGWERRHAQKILGFAPEERPTCVLVNATEGVQYLDAVSELLVDAFKQFCARGPLCGEPVRGVRIDVVDAKIHPDGPHRRAPEVVPACARGMSGALMCASPCLIEPIFSLDMTAPLNLMGKVHQVLSGRRGRVTLQESHPSDPETQLLSGIIPVSQSIGLSAELREKTRGQAIHSCRFDHWEAVPGDATDTNGRAAEAVRGIRARKGLPAALPSAASLLDKL